MAWIGRISGVLEGDLALRGSELCQCCAKKVPAPHGHVKLAERRGAVAGRSLGALHLACPLH